MLSHFALIGLIGLGFLANDVEDAVFEGLLVLAKTILLPSVVEDTSVEVVSLHASLEEADASAIVRILLKLERATVFHELTELNGVTSTQLLQRRLNLLLLNVVILFVLAAPRETLPRQRSLDEVKQHVANSLQVVSSGLLNALVRSNGCIPGRSCQILAVLVRDVFALTILEALG